VKESVDEVEKTDRLVEMVFILVVPAVVVNKYGGKIVQPDSFGLSNAVLFRSVESHDWDLDLALLFCCEEIR
jgi:hypothetical protein